MVKRLSRDRGHIVTEEVKEIARQLEELLGEGRVKYGELGHHKHPEKPKIEFRGYDEQHKVIKLRLNRSDYNQVILIVNASQEDLKKVADYIKK